MRLVPGLPAALLMLAALAVAACGKFVIRPPGDAAGFYANGHGQGER
jgi:hypothetical protein